MPNTQTKDDGVNLRKKPFRGILSEIAREQGVSRVAIHHAIYKNNNPRILEIYMKKIDAVKATIQRYKTNYENAGAVQ